MRKAKSRGTRQPAVKSAAVKNPTPRETRRATTTAESRLAGTPEKLAMGLPNQSPPVERQYLRALVGRQGKPSSPDASGGSGKKATKDQQVDDYFVQLATFHVRPNRRV